MNIALNKPIEHVEVVKTPVSLTEVELDFVLIQPRENRLQLKLNPTGLMIDLQGESYVAVSEALEKALTKALTPIVNAALAPAGEEAK